MTPLSDALTAAQRSALAALEKAYVAEQIDREGFEAELGAVGICDRVDVAFLAASLDVLRAWGVSAPTMTERVARERRESEPASEKQLALIQKLAGVLPDYPFTKEQASQAIDELQNGTYKPEKYSVPF